MTEEFETMTVPELKELLRERDSRSEARSQS